MIGQALNFLRQDLNAFLQERLGDIGEGSDPTEDRVVFVDGDKLDPLTFALNSVSMLLISLEEERQMRAPDLYARRLGSADAPVQRGNPDIRLILYSLFVARFRDYDVAWDHLASIIERFQSVGVFERTSFPTMPPSADKLVVELVPLNFSQQNEVWSALRVSHHPSVVYRLKLLTFRDQNLQTPSVVLEAPQRNIVRK